MRWVDPGAVHLTPKRLGAVPDERIPTVYINQRARDELGWKPRFDFRNALNRVKRGHDVFSHLARSVGSKGYHVQRFEQGPYPVEREV